MTQKTAAQIVADAGTYLADNDAREISAEDVRQRIIDLADSFANLLDLATANLSVGSLNKVTVTPPATGSTLTIADGKTLTASNTLTLAGTDGSTLNVGGGGTLGTAAYKNTGTSGNTVPLMDGANTWSALQINTADIRIVNPGSSANLSIGSTVNTNSQVTIRHSTNADGTGGSTVGYFGRISGNLGIFDSSATLIVGQISGVSDSIGIWGTDLRLARDAANTLAQRNGTNAQTQNWYGNYTGTTNYQRGAKKVAKATLSGVSGATVTASALIPKGAVVYGLTTRINTSLGTGSGTTGYTVGDGSDADRWGDLTATAAGSSTSNSDWTADGSGWFGAATDVVITAKGGNFNGTGVIEVCVFYDMGEAD